VNRKLLPKIRIAKCLSSLQAQKQVPTVNIEHNSRFRGFDLAHTLNSEPRLDSSHITHRESHPSIENATDFDRQYISENATLKHLHHWGTGQGDPSLPRACRMQPLHTIGHKEDVSYYTFQVAHSIPLPKPTKTEKQKMMNGEPFLPCDV
jgi:hypothetical protein